VAGSGCGRLNEPGTFSFGDGLWLLPNFKLVSVLDNLILTKEFNNIWRFFQGLCNFSISLLKGISLKFLQKLWAIE
jgi:hypothetical protein